VEALGLPTLCKHRFRTNSSCVLCSSFLSKLYLFLPLEKRKGTNKGTSKRTGLSIYFLGQQTHGQTWQAFHPGSKRRLSLHAPIAQLRFLTEVGSRAQSQSYIKPHSETPIRIQLPQASPSPHSSLLPSSPCLHFSRLCKLGETHSSTTNQIVIHHVSLHMDSWCHRRDRGALLCATATRERAYSSL
jgi:hypothetical protein